MNKKSKDPEFSKEYAPYLRLLTQIGLIMISSIFLGFIGGFLIGKFLGYPNFGLLLGTLSGVFLGFWLVYKLCLKKI